MPCRLGFGGRPLRCPFGRPPSNGGTNKLKKYHVTALCRSAEWRMERFAVTMPLVEDGYLHLEAETVTVEAPGPPPQSLGGQSRGVTRVQGHKSRVELDVTGPVRDEGLVLVLGGRADAFDIEPHRSFRAVRAKVADAGAQEPVSAYEGAAGYVDMGRRELDEAFVEVADIAHLFLPDLLKGLVTFEELVGIELAAGFEQVSFDRYDLRARGSGHAASLPRTRPRGCAQGHPAGE